MGTIFTIKSIKDVKSKYKPRSDYYLGQTLSRLESKKRNLRKQEPSLRSPHVLNYEDFSFKPLTYTKCFILSSA